jgi:hypothetical protein
MRKHAFDLKYMDYFSFPGAACRYQVLKIKAALQFFPLLVDFEDVIIISTTNKSIFVVKPSCMVDYLPRIPEIV